MNKVEEFAKLLEIELNKEFKIKNKQGNIICTASLDKTSGLNIIEQFGNFLDIYGNAATNDLVINGLLTGTYSIIKPFIPSPGKTYYYISGSIYSGLHILSSKFSGKPSEYAMLEKDWFFNTEKDAQDFIKFMEKQLKKLNRKYGISGN